LLRNIPQTSELEQKRADLLTCGRKHLQGIAVRVNEDKLVVHENEKWFVHIQKNEMRAIHSGNPEFSFS
jgi:hypothetical protein